MTEDDGERLLIDFPFSNFCLLVFHEEDTAFQLLLSFWRSGSAYKTSPFRCHYFLPFAPSFSQRSTFARATLQSVSYSFSFPHLFLDPVSPSPSTSVLFNGHAVANVSHFPSYFSPSVASARLFPSPSFQWVCAGHRSRFYVAFTIEHRFLLLPFFLPLYFL